MQLFAGGLCAYHIPGGSFAMRFTGNDFVFEDDGAGGRFLVGTFELTILEGTGIYKPFAGGPTTWSTSCTSSLLATVPAASAGSASATSVVHNKQQS